MSEDWLDTGEEEPTAGVPAVIPNLPTDIVARAELIEKCWTKLSIKQKIFLEAFRDNHFNARRTAKTLENVVSRTSHIGWMREDESYALIVRLWEANAARAALNPERLLRRQDEIVELAMTPRPILYQGAHTGFEEIDVSAAARANAELLDRAVPKNSEEKTRVVVNIVRLTGENDPDE